MEDITKSSFPSPPFSSIQGGAQDGPEQARRVPAPGREPRSAVPPHHAPGAEDEGAPIRAIHRHEGGVRRGEDRVPGQGRQEGHQGQDQPGEAPGQVSASFGVFFWVGGQGRISQNLRYYTDVISL